MMKCTIEIKHKIQLVLLSQVIFLSQQNVIVHGILLSYNGRILLMIECWGLTGESKSITVTLLPQYSIKWPATHCHIINNEDIFMIFLLDLLSMNTKLTTKCTVKNHPTVILLVEMEATMLQAWLLITVFITRFCLGPDCCAGASIHSAITSL